MWKKPYSTIKANLIIKGSYKKNQTDTEYNNSIKSICIVNKAISLIKQHLFIHHTAAF